MLLIKNIGNRDVIYQQKYMDDQPVRTIGQDLLDNYEKIKQDLSFPIIEPALNLFAPQLSKICLFVTNQADEMKRASDTLFFGELMRKAITENHSIEVEIFQYTSNPADIEKSFGYYTEKLMDKNSIFRGSEKKIIVLSGGTPQMKMGMHMMFSSLLSINSEFYNVVDGQLEAVPQKRTVNKILTQHACMQLLQIYEYQSILEILKVNGYMRSPELITLLEYAHHRKNFDFEASQERWDALKKILPSIKLTEYSFLELSLPPSPLFLIQELLNNLEVVYQNQNYLLYTALLFRMEEGILTEMVNLFYKNKIGTSLVKKEDHVKLLEYVKNNESDVWTYLTTLTFKNEVLNLKMDFLNRPTLFYLAYKNELESPTKTFKPLLHILDKITKYFYDTLTEDERKQKYGDKTTKECLGDLRNKSIIAHGFTPVSKEKMVKKYRNGNTSLESLHRDLCAHVKKILKLLSNNSQFQGINIFDQLNQMLKNLLHDL